MYAFGVLLLEVVAGIRPLGSSGQFLLVDWVLENCQLGQILRVVDPKLGSVYDEEEVELVLKLGNEGELVREENPNGWWR